MQPLKTSTWLLSFLGLVAFSTASSSNESFTATPTITPTTTASTPNFAPALNEEDDEPGSPACTGRLIPGLEKMTRGVDITELVLFPTDLPQRNGFRKPVIELTCVKKQKWTHPSTDLDTEYSRPDQVAGVNTNSAGDMTARIELTGNSDEFKESRLAKVGLSVTTEAYGAYSASVEMKTVQENIYRSNQSIAETTATVSSILIDFKTPRMLPLTEDFLLFLKDCSAPYEETPEVYDSLVDTFGTHFFETATFGGYMHQKTLIDERYSLETTERELKVNLEASFASVVKATAEDEEKKKRISESFKSNTRTSFAFYGGEPVTIDPAQPPGHFLETWVPKVNRDPWLFGGQLKSIEELIANRTIRAEVRKAITFRKIRAYLGEVKYQLSISRFPLDAKDAATLREIEQKLSAKKGPQDVAQVVANLKNIQRLIQQFQDRNLLRQSKTRLANLPSLYCTNFAVSCTHYVGGKTYHWQQALATMEKDWDAWEALKTKLTNLAAKEGSLDHEEARETVKEATEMIIQQDSKEVDLCSGSWKSSCDSCRQLILHHECTLPAIRKLLKWV